MDPLFALPQQPAPIFGRTTNFEYKKCLPDSVFQSFAPSARHSFRWQNQAGEWWVPSQSYLRIRFAFCAVKDDLTGLRGITAEDGVAPVMNLPPHLFSRMEYFMDGNKLSELQDYVPQIDTMKHRMMKSRAYMSSVGNRACFWSPDFAARQKLIVPNQGGALNPSNMQTGDIPGQRIVMRAGRVYDAYGQPHDINTPAADGCFFGRYVIASSVAASDQTSPAAPSDIEIYGPAFCSGVEKKSSDWKEREVLLGTPTGTLQTTPATTRVLLTMTFKKGESRSVVATWYSALELYVVHKSSSQYDVGDGTHTGFAHSTFPVLPGEFFTDFKNTFLPEVFPQARKAADYGAITLASGNFVTDVVVTPLEPSQQIAGASRHEICWKPTLGIFDVAHALPTTRHELHLQIPNNYQERCWDFGHTQPTPSWIQNRLLDPRLSNTANYALADRGKVFLRIESLEFFAAMASGPRADDAKFVLDLREYRMIPQLIPLTQTDASQTYPFNLASNTSSVSVAFQSAKAGTGSCSLSKFVVPTAIFSRGAETALSRFYVNFANQNRPREENESFITYQGPNGDIKGSGNSREGTTQFFTQRYLESMTNTGQLFKPGGCETLEEWLERGAYYNWMWPRDGNDLSTRFHVFCAFTAAAKDLTSDAAFAGELVSRGWPDKISEQNNDINILIFDMIPRAFSLVLRNGMVVSAETTSSMIADGVRRIRTE